MDSEFQFHPVAEDRLADLSQFSIKHGKFRYCSCMRWRLRSSEFQRSSKDERIEKLDDLVNENVPVGILGYAMGEPVGWCSVAPRSTFEALLASRTIPEIDEKEVWSVVCFFVDRRHRRLGLTLKLLESAVEYAFSKGAPAVEGYPVPPDASSYAYMGSPGTFL